MRRIAFLLLLTLGFAPQALAAKLVSVAELEQFLAASHGQSDARVARQLSGFELTERASSARLAQWQAAFPGHRCHEAFTVLADASAILDLPAADIPAMPLPEHDELKAMLRKTVDYLNTTISRLPNFYATRKTDYFEDTPPHATTEQFASPAGRPRSAAGSPSVESSYLPMHSAGTSSVIVSYREGHEMRGSKRADDDSLSRLDGHLASRGEFGHILIVVLGNAIHNKIEWSHWEKDSSGVSAVFRYRVPQGQTNYMVLVPHRGGTEQTFPAFHGELAIDPDDGSIVRVTVIADFYPPLEQVKSSILVEYASVSIGGAPYICPIKSVALAKMPVEGEQDFVMSYQTQLNDVAFTNYHLFRSESRVLTGADVTNDQAPPPPK